jgi:histidinol dehydrogenase
MPDKITVPGRIVTLAEEPQTAGQLVPSYCPEHVMLELAGMSDHSPELNGAGSVTP